MPEKFWNIDMVKGRQALSLLPRRSDGSGQVDWGETEVALIDTGYTEHPVMGPWQEGKSPIVRVDDGLNLMERGARAQDSLDYEGTPGHGTRVASVLCGNLPGSFVGLAPGLSMIPYRAFNHVVISSKHARKRIAESIRHAVDISAAEVISMSFGFPQMSLFAQRHLGEAVDHAYDRGIIMVCAGGQIVDRVTYPGKFSRTIGVGGVTPKRRVWFRYDKSMAKRSIDIWAPADDVLRANSMLRDGEVVPDANGPGDGTSYATVHVAAAAAMWLRRREDELDEAYPEPWQRVEAFRNILTETSQDVAGDYWPERSRGILDIEALLKANLPDPGKLKREDRKAADEIF
ncbi:S8/S53 family peptidase [Ferruginivarius sediminum]|uniref:Peptidase S8/S53 domain-containing protein n=1 Tax=Ferruginivarius sediminum TaxID=2661937 RepID=A0A369T7C1_9PROT|nr:S8/S53 family peptidase [Ferruginivarius sediminum]RDD60772.1 hypothetical protein DRB17_16370 [Ferruginivarius sediminum]